MVVSISNTPGKTISEKNCFIPMKCKKVRKKEFVKSADGLLNHKLTTTANIVNQAGYDGENILFLHVVLA